MNEKKENKGKWDLRAERRDREIRDREARQRDPPRDAVAATHFKPTCRRRRLLETHLPLPLTSIYSYLFLQNLINIKCLWSDLRIWDSQKLCLCLVDWWWFMFVFLLMNWTDVGNWLIMNWICAACGKFFFFWAFWLYDCVCNSLYR